MNTRNKRDTGQKSNHIFQGVAKSWLDFSLVSPNPRQTHTFRCGFKSKGFGDKKRSEIGNRKILLIGIMLIIFITLLVQAQGGGELEAELAQLEQGLGVGGYGWLTNYSGDDLYQTASIEVYRENDNQLITVINNISEEGWYKTFLTGLSENESQSTFDLKIKDIKIPYNIFQKKKRIDEIRRLIELPKKVTKVI